MRLSHRDWFRSFMLEGFIIAPTQVPSLGSDTIGSPISDMPSKKLAEIRQLRSPSPDGVWKMKKGEHTRLVVEEAWIRNRQRSLVSMDVRVWANAKLRLDAGI